MKKTHINQDSFCCKWQTYLKLLKARGWGKYRDNFLAQSPSGIGFRHSLFRGPHLSPCLRLSSCFSGCSPSAPAAAGGPCWEQPQGHTFQPVSRSPGVCYWTRGPHAGSLSRDLLEQGGGGFPEKRRKLVRATTPAITWEQGWGGGSKATAAKAEGKISTLVFFFRVSISFNKHSYSHFYVPGMF